MSDKIGTLVNTLLDGIHSISKSETIVGEPQQAGDAVVIPVHRVKVAFGAATAKAGAHNARVGGDTGGHATGGAVELDPVAAIAIAKDGTAHVLTVDADPASTWAGLLEEVPELVTKVVHGLGGRVVTALAEKPAPKLEGSAEEEGG